MPSHSVTGMSASQLRIALPASVTSAVSSATQSSTSPGLAAGLGTAVPFWHAADGGTGGGQSGSPVSSRSWWRTARSAGGMQPASSVLPLSDSRSSAGSSPSAGGTIPVSALFPSRSSSSADSRLNCGSMRPVSPTDSKSIARTRAGVPATVTPSQAVIGV